jgi:hypothetical protein
MIVTEDVAYFGTMFVSNWEPHRFDAFRIEPIKNDNTILFYIHHSLSINNNIQWVDMFVTYVDFSFGSALTMIWKLNNVNYKIIKQFTPDQYRTELLRLQKKNRKNTKYLLHPELEAKHPDLNHGFGLPADIARTIKTQWFGGTRRRKRRLRHRTHRKR